ncbi:MAG: hypothetical protein LBS67_04035 [Clostridiales Family XIII bacterium]|jgi:hypothetical protein|nr:hypothetical protein [Clostridiales Family XIII bacterium]
MRKTLPFDRRHIVLILILAFSCAVSLHFAQEKQGFHIDELHTFEQTNGDDYRRANSDPDFYNVWHTGDEVRDWLALDPKDRFNYGQVILDSKGNTAHPPLYFLTAHTIRSIFSGAFSKWALIALNMAFYIGTILMLYAMGRMLTRNRWIPLIACFVYGVGPGAINMVMFLRMYTMASFFAICFAYLLGKMMLRGDTAGRLWKLSLVAFLGFMTHYYLLIFVFLLSVGYCICLLLKKQGMRSFLKRFLKFAGAMLVSLSLTYLCNPTMLQDILSGKRGSKTVQILTGGEEHAFNAKEIWRVLSDSMFGGAFFVPFSIAFVLILVFFLGYCLWRLSPEATRAKYPVALGNIFTRCKDSQYFGVFLILFFSIILYTLFLAKVAPYISDRYLSLVFPVTMVVILMAFDRGLSYCGKRFKRPVLIGCAALSLVVACLLPSGMKYLYPNKALIGEFAEGFRDYSVIYVACPDKHPQNVTTSLPLLMEFSEAYVTKIKRLERLESDIGELSSPNKIVVVVGGEEVIDVENAMDVAETVKGYAEKYSGFPLKLQERAFKFKDGTRRAFVLQ